MSIDPDWNDWYTATGDNPGDPIWFDNDAAAQEHFGEGGFNNIGTEAFGFNPETGNNILYGNKGNQYEFSTMLSEVEVDGGRMSDHARTMLNPIVQEMHIGQKEFVKGSFELAGHVTGEFGEWTSYAGYAASVVPGAQPLAGCLITVGNGLLTASSFSYGMADVIEHDIQGALFNGVNAVIPGRVNRWIGKKVNSKVLTQQSGNILKAGTNIKSIIIDKKINP